MFKGVLSLIRWLAALCLTQLRTTGLNSGLISGDLD
jgi:hypothetical protein